MKRGVLSVIRRARRAPTPYIQRRAAGWRLLLFVFLRTYFTTYTHRECNMFREPCQCGEYGA